MPTENLAEDSPYRSLIGFRHGMPEPEKASERSVPRWR